jgi:hypothetical protein
LIIPHDTAQRRAEYAAKGLSDKRYRWDLSYLSGNANNPESCTRFVCDTLYTYLNDSHIDTALRSIVKPLPRNPAA